MLTDEQKAAGWIEHDGGPCPVALSSRPTVLFRNGRTEPAYASTLALRSKYWGDWWQHEGPDHAFDIIAYRPENPHD